MPQLTREQMYWVIEDPVNREHNVARNISVTGAREILDEISAAARAMKNGQPWHKVMAPVTRSKTLLRQKRTLQQPSQCQSKKRRRFTIEPPIALRPPIHLD